ncbi:hypothetical protein C8R44DRAFT_734962 [Mycena epipterygia]|nr:hypothetical protein C8R44DRAFT_734962 [Mycena epipterygia]
MSFPTTKNTDPVLLRVPGDSDSTKAVKVTYAGSVDLTIDPKIGDTSTLKKDQTIQVLKSAEKHSFKAKTTTIATVWNRSDMDKIEVEGGTDVANTSTLTITITLK